MRILIVTDYFYPHWTGIVKSVVNFINAYNSKFEITVLTVRHQKNLKKIENLFGAKVIREDYLLPISRSKYSIQILNKFTELIKYNDIVLINSPFTNILPVALLTKLYKKRLVIFHQGDLNLPNGLFNHMLEKVFDLSSLLAFTLSNNVATYTLDYANYSRVLKPFLHKTITFFIPLPKKKVESILNSKLRILSEKKAQGKVVMGFGGRFVEEKGFHILLEAIPKIIDEGNNIIFAFAGEAKMNYENYFEKNKALYAKAQKNILMLGLLNEQELEEYYSLLDFIIIPSITDCFNLMQEEAMSRGIPAITSDVPGASFLVKSSGFGVLFKKGNATDLKNMITHAILHKKEILQNREKLNEIIRLEEDDKKIRKFIEG